MYYIIIFQVSIFTDKCVYEGEGVTSGKYSECA